MEPLIATVNETDEEQYWQQCDFLAKQGYRLMVAACGTVTDRSGEIGQYWMAVWAAPQVLP